MTAGNVDDLWETKIADQLPATLVANVFEFFYVRVFLPNAVAMSALAFGAGIEFGACPAISEDAVADYVASAANIKNINGVVTNSPLSGITTPAGGQDFWLYVKDTSAFVADDARTRRLGARQAVLNSVK